MNLAAPIWGSHFERLGFKFQRDAYQIQFFAFEKFVTNQIEIEIKLFNLIKSRLKEILCSKDSEKMKKGKKK